MAKEKFGKRMAMTEYHLVWLITATTIAPHTNVNYSKKSIVETLSKRLDSFNGRHFSLALASRGGGRSFQ